MILDKIHCDICQEKESRWRPYGSIVSYCDTCWIDHLTKTKGQCEDCEEEFAMGALCYDGWERYVYRCPECQHSYFDWIGEESTRVLYSEGVITMLDEVRKNLKQ